jgi:glycosyltransferase involved in cell wall biosynthesis
MTRGRLEISAVIPTYNAGNYLLEALESAWGQSRPPDEIVVVDDGSTDKTKEILEPYRSRIRYYRQENQGICATRNKGIELAGGNAIAFLDADDLWPDGSLEARAEALEADPEIEGVVGIVEQFLSPDTPDDLKDRFFVPPDRRVGRLAGSMLLRRRAFEMAGLFDPKVSIGDTIDWLLRADAAGVRIRPVETLVLRRRIHGSNTTAQDQAETSEYLKILKANLDRRRALGRDDDRG